MRGGLRRHDFFPITAHAGHLVSGSKEGTDHDGHECDDDHWSRPRDGLHYLWLLGIGPRERRTIVLKAIDRITHTEADGVFHAHRQTRKPCKRWLSATLGRRSESSSQIHPVRHCL